MFLPEHMVIFFGFRSLCGHCSCLCRLLLLGYVHCNVVTLNKIRIYCNYLQEVEDRLPSELSGGMKKRVALARSIIFDTTKDTVEPEVCFLLSR